MTKKNILIVGGSSGLGFELIKEYNYQGHKVFLLTKNIKNLKKNLKTSKINKNFYYSYVDLTSIKDIKKQIQKVKKYFKNTIHNVIHISGGGLGIKEIDPKYEKLIKVMNLNILSLIEINKLIIPLMIKKKRGVIVHLSSIAAFEAVGSLSYNLSKAALNSYIRTMGRYLAKYNVVLTGIAPGGFIAQDNAMYRLKNKNINIYKDFIKYRIPRGKMGKTKEIIPLINFLCSEVSGMMSGCIIPIDGGEGKFYNS